MLRIDELEEQLEEIMEEVKDDYRAALRPGWEELQIELENNINIVNMNFQTLIDFLEA